MNLTYRYRVKDKHSRTLNRMARDVNFVWNYCNDLQKHALKWRQRWPTSMSITYMLAGASESMCILANTINDVGQRYVKLRKTSKKAYLRYRGKKSLGWVPIKGVDIKPCMGGFRFSRKNFSVWLSRKIPEGAKICDGSSFSQDARGRWYLNIVIEVPEQESREPRKAVGIDLGLKDLATLSTGEKIAAPQYYRAAQERLAKAQRAKKRKQVTKLHAKIANQRKDFLHKVTTDIVNRFDHIVVGNVSAKALARTRMAKSVLDASWSNLKKQLRYKSIRNGAVYEEVNEAYSSQVCSSCGEITAGSPRGAKDLGVRQWICDGCGCEHDRDLNASLNILARGRQATLVAGAAI